MLKRPRKARVENSLKAVTWRPWFFDFPVVTCMAAEAPKSTPGRLPCPAALTGTFDAKGVLEIPPDGLQAGEERLKRIQAPFPHLSII
jgi:hypothetical protein